jgi:hypothetical protein
MTDYILNHARPMDRAHLSHMHQGEEGQPTLEIKLYYSKDMRRRGLYLSVSRCLVSHTATGFTSTAYDLLNRYNGLVHIADMARKPSPKIAAQWESTVRVKLDAIAEIALASDAPDWPAVRVLFQEVVA